MHSLDLSLQIQYIFSQFGYIDQSLLSYFDFPLILGDFDPDHAYLILNILDVHLCSSQDVLLDVAFLIEDAEFIVAVDELDTCDVAVFAGLFVLLTETLHITLKGDDDHV